MAEFPDRKKGLYKPGIVQDFGKVSKALRETDEMVQLAVGHGINMASSVFFKRFDSVLEFCSLDNLERVKFIDSMTDFASNVCAEDPSSATGIDLFRVWLIAAIEGDQELTSRYKKHLEYFSMKGDLSGLDLGHWPQ